MRAIIVLGLSVFTQAAFSQQQQQFVNNISNTNIQYRGNLNNDNVNFIQNNISQINSRAVQSQKLVSNTLRARPTRKYTQVKVTNTNKNVVTAQVKRPNPRPRPRVVNPPQNVGMNNSLNNNERVLGNEFNPVIQTINFINNEDVQVQNLSINTPQGSNPFQQQDISNVGSQVDLNIDLSLNLKGGSNIKTRSSSASTSSSNYRSQVFSKRIAKFKRNFLGKLSSHKKSKHHLDVCFNWKK